MSDAKNGSIPVFPMALPALPFPKQPQRLEGMCPGALGCLIQSSARTREHIAVIIGCKEAWLREVGVSLIDRFRSIWETDLERAHASFSLTVMLLLLFSRSVVSNSLQPHGLQHARLPCLSPTPEACTAHVHGVSDAIYPSHPLSSPSPPALNLSQHQGLSQWVNSSHQVAKVLELQL